MLAIRQTAEFTGFPHEIQLFSSWPLAFSLDQKLQADSQWLKAKSRTRTAKRIFLPAPAPNGLQVSGFRLPEQQFFADTRGLEPEAGFLARAGRKMIG